MLIQEPHVAPPTGVKGSPSTLRTGVVVTVNSDGSVDVRAEDSRSGWRSLVPPRWYVPTSGDRVLVGNVQGDSQQMTLLLPLTGQRPAVTGSRGGNVALASLLTALDGLGLITNSTTA